MISVGGVFGIAPELMCTIRRAIEDFIRFLYIHRHTNTQSYKLTNSQSSRLRLESLLLPQLII